MATCDVLSEPVCGVEDADLLDDREDHQTGGLPPRLKGLWLHCFAVTEDCEDLTETGVLTSPLVTVVSDDVRDGVTASSANKLSAAFTYKEKPDSSIHRLGGLGGLEGTNMQRKQPVGRG